MASNKVEFLWWWISCKLLTTTPHDLIFTSILHFNTPFFLDLKWVQLHGYSEFDHKIEYIQKNSLLGTTKAHYPNLGSSISKTGLHSTQCTLVHALLICYIILSGKALGEILEVYLEDTLYPWIYAFQKIEGSYACSVRDCKGSEA
jgi:hypothetical protein